MSAAALELSSASAHLPSLFFSGKQVVTFRADLAISCLFLHQMHRYGTAGA